MRFHNSLTRTLNSRTAWTRLAGVTIVGTLASCGGEGAGDLGEDFLEQIQAADTSALQPLVGTYNLVGNWNGVPDDEALLVFREPMSDGTAEVVIYDFASDLTDCYLRLRPGTARFDTINNTVFLDDIVQFDAAQLSLSGSTLVIDYFDTIDADNDNDTEEQLRYLAPSVGIVEQDISPLC